MTEDANTKDHNKNRNRKKRKSFIVNARKYAKKGQVGRGTKMPEELSQYFMGILDAIKQGIHDEDQRDSLVSNVLERTKDEELNVVGNQVGCRLVEMLLPYSGPEDLERFMDVLSPDLRKLCSDNFSSHVVETLLRVSCERATEHLQSEENADESDTEDEAPKKKKQKTEVVKSASKYAEDHVKKCYDFTIKISKYALNNLEDFVWDSYANHILRSALKCLSGITLLPGEKPKVNLLKEDKQIKKGIPPHMTKINYKIVPQEFKDLVKEFANRLMAWPQFNDLPYKNITSGLLQVLLYSVKNVDKKLTRTLVKKLLEESFAPDDWMSGDRDEKKKDVKFDIEEENNGESEMRNGNLPPVFDSEPAVRLLEAALFVSKKKTYTQMYAKCFINRLGQLATLPMLNFTVQRLIDNCVIKEEFEPMYDELSDKLAAILSCGNTGVLVALVKACLKLKAKQTQFITSLESILKCSEAENQKYLSVCCLRLLPLDRVDVTKLDKEYFINIHGSVILQTVLNFQRPTKAVSSLLELSSEELLVILCDVKGCHVADSFCQGQFVGVKARDKLIWKLKGFYQKLALSQHGSRAFEQIFSVATLEQKIKIMTELSDKSNLLNSTNYGRLIAGKLNVETFKLSQKKWEQMWSKEEETKEDK